MRKLWAVMQREYLERVRTRWFLIATVFGPLLFGAMMFLPAYMASRSGPSGDVSRIRILDATGTALGQRVAAALNGGIMGDTSRTQVRLLLPNELAAAESSATQAVIEQRIKGYLAFDAQTLAGGPIHYAGTNATAFADMQALQGAVRRELLGLRLEGAGISAADAATLKTLRADLRPERITPRGRGGSGRVNVFFAIGVAMLLYVTILLYGQNVLRGVLEEKQTRVAEVVVSSVPAPTLLAGKVLGVGAVGLTQILIWIASSLVMLKVRAPVLRQLGMDVTPLQLPAITPAMLALLVVFFVLGYVLYSSLFAAVGAMVSSEQEAQQAQMPVVMILVFAVAFVQPMLEAPDGRLATSLSLLPFTSPIIMPLRLAMVSVAPWDVVSSLVVLAASCYVCVYAAARVYRTGLLLYGKRATLREVARWVVRAR